MAFKDIFKDNNEFNEKTIIGFMSFAIMCVFALTDIITGIFGITLEIKEFIYNGFQLITLGSFGIAGIEKFSPTAKVHAEADAKMQAESGAPDPE